MVKLSIILLVVSLLVMIPTLTLTIINARNLNNQDPYNKPSENNNFIDKSFIWILGALLLGFMLFCGALFMYINERNIIPQMTTNTKFI